MASIYRSVAALTLLFFVWGITVEAVDQLNKDLHKDVKVEAVEAEDKSEEFSDLNLNGLDLIWSFAVVHFIGTAERVYTFSYLGPNSNRMQWHIPLYVQDCVFII